MTEGQVQVARRHPATPIDRSGGPAPEYFLDWAFEEARRILAGREFVVVAKTTIDPALQEAAEHAVESHLRQYGSEMGVAQAGLVSLDMEGAVRALVGGRDYGESQFNRATQAQRQPGSSFKGYVYVAAMLNGYTPESIVPDAPINIGGWSPRNYGRSYRGPVSLITALAHSINTVPVRLAQSVGREKIVDIAAELGVRTPLRISRPLPLGVSEMTVMDQAAGYGAFANGGYRMDPFAITEMRTLSGDVVYSHDAESRERRRVIPPETAADMNRMLHAVNEWGTGRRALIPGIPTAGKTGTSQAHRDAWYVGYTGNYVTAVWMGNDDFRPTRRLVGGRLPAMAWQQFMSYAHQGITLQPIPGVGGVPEAPLIADAGDGEEGDGLRPLTLSPRSAELLRVIGRMMRDARPVSLPDEISELPFRGQPIDRFAEQAAPATPEAAAPEPAAVAPPSDAAAPGPDQEAAAPGFRRFSTDPIETPRPRFSTDPSRVASD